MADEGLHFFFQDRYQDQAHRLAQLRLEQVLKLVLTHWGKFGILDSEIHEYPPVSVAGCYLRILSSRFLHKTKCTAFAGGGIISLTALFENLVEKAIVVELDDEVAAVWETIVNGDAEWLAHRILTFPMTRESVKEEL